MLRDDMIHPDSCNISWDIEEQNDLAEAYEIVEERMRLSKPSDSADDANDEDDSDWDTFTFEKQPPACVVEPPQVAKMPIITVKGSSKLLTVIEDYTSSKATLEVLKRHGEDPTVDKPPTTAGAASETRGGPAGGAVTVPPVVKEMNPAYLKRVISRRDEDIVEMYRRHDALKQQIESLEIEHSGEQQQHIKEIVDTYRKERDILKAVNESYRCQSASLKELVSVREQEIVDLRVTTDKASKRITEQDQTIRRLQTTLQESQSLNLHLKNKVETILGRLKVVSSSSPTHVVQ